MDRQLNKSLDDLSVSGDALAVFGLWGCITVLLYILFASKYIPIMFGYAESDTAMITFATVIWALVQLIEFIIRIFVRKAAKLEKKGKSGWGYLIITFLILILYIYSLIHDFTSYSQLANDTKNPLSSIIMDFATVLISGRLLYSGIRVKSLRKQMAREAKFYAD